MAKWLKLQAAFERLIVANAQDFPTLFGLIDVFGSPEGTRRYHPRIPVDGTSWCEKHIFPLPPTQRGGREQLCTVENIGYFRQRLDTFSHQCLSTINDWEGILIAGGAVQICLMNGNLTSIRTSSADIDIFFYGTAETEVIEWKRDNHMNLTPLHPQRQIKVNEIYAQLCAFVGCRIKFKCTDNAMTLYRKWSSKDTEGIC